MAEAAVRLVIDKLVPPLVEEAQVLKGVHGEVADIKDELESMQAFLREADAREELGDLNDGLKIWVKQVREAAFRIEDVIDQYLLHVALHADEGGFIGFLRKVALLIRKLIKGHEIASEIQDIKTSICKIKARSERYGFDSSGQASTSGAKNTTWHDPREASLFIEEDEIVGIESPREELISFLVGGESSRTVISLLGMGGLGKTTLARKVYENENVSGHFDCHAWISVSQSYRMEELLKNMIQQFYQERKESAPVGIDTMDKRRLIKILKENLPQKRYVVVFDDVWEVNFWEAIKYALPTSNKGSRIIITTRSDVVASTCKESPFDRVHKLQPLPQEKAWELFCKKAFQSDNGGNCPPVLKNLSLEIVGRCEGLPLAIVAIGGLLSTKGNDASEWQKLKDSLGSELETNPRLSGITRILSLSYYDISYNLKSCFLYFGIFPEDYSISCMRLIRLWIAEGFIKGKRGKTLEEVALDYIIELNHRSLIQVSQTYTDGKVRSCRVHDLMREIILSKLEDLSFCLVMGKEESRFDGKPRRLSIQNSTNIVVESISDSPVRSVFLFMIDKLPESLTATFIANFKLLKVLDFQGAPLHFLSEEVGNLFHLTYLSMRSTKIKVLPKSIGKLLKLQTLDLKECLVHELPIELNLLLNMRHLLVYSYNLEISNRFNMAQGVKMQEGFGCLEALQKLCYVEANHGLGLVTKLRKLKQLRKLGIMNLTREQGRALCASIEEMNHLVSLIVQSISANEILDIQHISSPPPFLRHLYVYGRLAKLPDWIAQSKLQFLVKLCFRWTGLTNDPLKVLQALPSLLWLMLYDGYEGEQLHFEEGGFQKLKVLRLEQLNGLNNVIIDKDAMPHLEELYIGPCPQLQTVPLGIQHLRELKALSFIDMPTFLPQLKPEVGELYGIVEHIPAVFFGFKRGGKMDWYNLRKIW